MIPLASHVEVHLLDTALVVLTQGSASLQFHQQPSQWFAGALPVLVASDLPQRHALPG